MGTQRATGVASRQWSVVPIECATITRVDTVAIPNGSDQGPRSVRYNRQETMDDDMIRFPS